MGAAVGRTVVGGIASNIPGVLQNTMNLMLWRSVEIEISNNSQNITLRNTGIYLDCGRCSVPPKPDLRPGSSDTSRFPGRYRLWGVAGVLVYEAESFTLAIHFNSIDYNRFRMELGLELSPGKAHLGILADTYTRMAHGTYSSSCSDIKFDRGIVVGKDHRKVQLSHGPIKVTAISSDSNSCLQVLLEEEGEWGEEGGTENPCRKRHYQEK